MNDIMLKFKKRKTAINTGQISVIITIVRTLAEINDITHENSVATRILQHLMPN